MWFRKARRIKELENLLFKAEASNFDMAHALFESQQFERIAREKVTLWVGKHDELLIKCKEQHGGFKKEESSAQIESAGGDTREHTPD